LGTGHECEAAAQYWRTPSAVDTYLGLPDILKVMPKSDVDLFRALYEANYERIAAYALRRAASPEDAGDVVSETFLTAWRRLDGLPRGEDATIWLYATARRVLGNQRRSSERRHRLLERIHQQPVSARRELGEAGIATEAFDRLRAEDQEILGLIAWDGLTHRQLGGVLGCSENAAKLRASRARQRFAAQIDRLRAPLKDQVISQPECATQIGEAG
jgi:RNA polymerase sigma factor (sigma-70 family)